MKKKIAMLAIAATVTITTLLGTSTTAFAKEGAAGVTAFSVEKQNMPLLLNGIEKAKDFIKI